MSFDISFFFANFVLLNGNSYCREEILNSLSVIVLGRSLTVNVGSFSLCQEKVKAKNNSSLRQGLHTVANTITLKPCS